MFPSLYYSSNIFCLFIQQVLLLQRLAAVEFCLEVVIVEMKFSVFNLERVVLRLQHPRIILQRIVVGLRDGGVVAGEEEHREGQEFDESFHGVRNIGWCHLPRRCPGGCRPAAYPRKRRDCCRSKWGEARKARSHRARFLPGCNSTKRGRAAPKPPKTTKPADTEFACVQRVGWRWWKRCNLLCYNEIGGGISPSVSARYIICFACGCIFFATAKVRLISHLAKFYLGGTVVTA